MKGLLCFLDEVFSKLFEKNPHNYNYFKGTPPFAKKQSGFQTFYLPLICTSSDDKTPHFFLSFFTGELSSISGSDSDTDSDGDLSMESAAQCTMSPINDHQFEGRDDIKLAVIGERKHPKVFFVNEDGDVLSVYRTVLYSVKVSFNDDGDDDGDDDVDDNVNDDRCGSRILTNFLNECRKHKLQGGKGDLRAGFLLLKVPFP